jgi:hypothetical protein
MSARRRLASCVFVLTVAARAASAQEVPQGFAVESRVDRPAMWVADRVTYVVEITVPRGFDILTEDLDRQKLKTTALDVVGGDSSRREDADAVRYRFRYELTSYRVDTPVFSIAPLPVRYYASRDGQRPDQLTPAGMLQVPGASVTFRSLLPDDQVSSPVRDDRGVPPRRARYRVLGLAGLTLMAISLVPALLSVAALARRAGERRLRTQRTVRDVRRNARAALDALHAVDPTGADARTAAFATLEGAVRQHLTDACGIAAAGMTPDELRRAAAACHIALPVETIAGVFEACELARYAAPEARPSAEDWRRALDRAEEILAVSR